MLVTALEIIGTLAAAGYFCSKLEDAFLAAKVRQIVAPTPPPTPSGLNMPVRDPIAWKPDDAQRERLLFLAVPSAWWLDPNRWGDDPHWRDDLPRPVEPRKRATPPPSNPKLACPNCRSTTTIGVSAVHGGQVSLYDCWDCGAEFTRDGRETLPSKKKRRLRSEAAEMRSEVAEIEDYLNTLPPPPADLSTRADGPYGEQLPCGCSGTVHTRAYPSHAGWDRGRYAVCNICDGTWDYDVNMRRKKKGTLVEWPNGNKLEAAKVDRPKVPSMPCGCNTDETMVLRGVDAHGYSRTMCKNCGAWWEPPSNNPKSFRVAQGSCVHYPNGTKSEPHFPPARPTR